MKKPYRFLLALAPFFALPTAGLAQTSAVPPYISYQGTVAAADGTPVGGNNAPVNRSVVFRIWSHPTNSALTDLLYSETQVVTIVDGQFSVLIGEGVTTTVGNYGAETTKKLTDIATAFAGKDCYLGVTVAAGASLATSDNEISPRQRIVSTGFAFRAKFAENLASGSDFTINPLTFPAGSVAGNYGLGWYGTGRLFGTTPATVDGPVLYGNSGGALGSSNGSGGTKNLALLWNNAGQVGIGATGTFAAGNKLTLQGDDSNTPAGQLSIRGNTDVNKRLLLGYNTTSNLGSLQSYTAASTAGPLLLNPGGGNVGIGKTDPSVALDVTGAIKASGDLTAANISTGQLSISSRVLTDAIDFFASTSRAGGLWRGGYAGALTNTSAGVNEMVLMGEGKLHLATANRGAAVMTLSGSNVGIGNAAPSVALDVTGAVKASTTIAAGTTITAGGKSVPTSDENDLKIVRGTIAANGTILSGSGFTVSGGGTNTNIITFTTSFAGSPSATTGLDTAVRGSNISLFVRADNTRLVVEFWDGNTAKMGTQYSFIAIGPR